MNGPLPTWLERWLGVDAAGVGEGTVWRLGCSWPYAPPSWAAPFTTSISIALGLVIAAWIGWLYRREAAEMSTWWRIALAIFRLSLLGLLFVMLAGFELRLERTGLPVVAVLLDTSASMAIADHQEDAELRALIERRLKEISASDFSRLSQAKWLLSRDNARWLEEFGQRFKLRFYFVAGSAHLQADSLEQLRERIAAARADGDASRLGAGLQSVLDDLRGTPLAAIVFLTDGANTEGVSLEQAAARARRKSTPVFTIGLGSERPERDIEMTAPLVDEVVFVDDDIQFEFKVIARGFEGRAVEVVLRDERAPEVALARQTITLGKDDEPLDVRLAYRPKTAGEFRYVLEIAPLAEESQLDNNRHLRLVSVREAKIQVLLAQAYPNHEFRYLKHMLQRDKTISLKSVLQEADVDYASQDSTALRTFPSRREELFEFDVILFGDVNPSLLGDATIRNLVEFVTEKGGGMVFMAGARYFPLAYAGSPLLDLLPVELEGAAIPDFGPTVSEAFRCLPTEDGRVSPNMSLGDPGEDLLRVWSELEPLYWYFDAPKLKPAARALAVHSGATSAGGEPTPLITRLYAGAGRVVFHAFDESSRWRIRRGDKYFARYWVQTIRYLSRAKLLGKDRSATLSADREEYRQGDPVLLRARFLDERRVPADDDGAQVMLQVEGGTPKTIALRRSPTHHGVFEGALDHADAGKYRAVLTAPRVEGDPPADDFLVIAPPGERENPRMDAAELKRLADETRGRFYRFADADRLLQDLPQGRQVPIERLPPIKLWNKWPMLTLFLGLLACEWLLRKRKGLP